MNIPKISLLAFIFIEILFSAAACSRIKATSTPSPAPLPPLEPGEHNRTVKVKDQTRSYVVYVPSGLDFLQPAPLVVAVHGAGSSSARLQSMTGFNTLADANGFLAAYPQGSGGDNTWNAGGCCRRSQAMNIDDVAFIREMISDLRTVANIDPKRIYATGHSNGAMFVYRLACEMSDTFAAAAPVSGMLFFNPCNPGQPVSVMHVHGLADPLVPYTGGAPAAFPSMSYPSVEQGIAAWVKLDGCTSEEQVEKDGIVTHTTYKTCQAGAAVEIYTLDGLGHVWPQPEVWPTSEMIWEFFVSHPKQ